MRFAKGKVVKREGLRRRLRRAAFGAGLAAGIFSLSAAESAQAVDFVGTGMAAAFSPE